MGHCFSKILDICTGRLPCNNATRARFAIEFESLRNCSALNCKAGPLRALLPVKPPHEKDDDDSVHVEFSGGNVQLITTKGKWDEKVAEAKKAGKIIIANFSASWCGPCRMIAPYYSELSVKYPSLMFLTVDVDELTEFSTSLDIKATPTFFFLRDGEQFDKLVGANKPELQNKVTAIADTLVPTEKI